MGAFDLISKKAMLEALMKLEFGPQILSFMRIFYVDSSAYFWEDEVGTDHHMDQGEGVEEGNALMSFLFSVGQYVALQAVPDEL